MPYRIHFLSSLIFNLNTMLRKITLNITLSYPRSHQTLVHMRGDECSLGSSGYLLFLCPRWPITLLPGLLKPVYCLLPGNHSAFLLFCQEKLDSLLWGTQNCILSTLWRLFPHTMTFSFWIPIFPYVTALSFPNFHLFPPFICPTLFLQGGNSISLLKANNYICVPNFVSTQLFILKLVTVHFFSP